MLFNKIRNLIRNQVARESGILFFAQFINIALGGIAFMILRPNFLSPNDVGLISYTSSIITTLALFFNFGIDNTGCRLIINEKNQYEKRRIAGMTLFISIILCILFGIVLFVVTFLIPYIGKSEAVVLVRLVIPFAAYSILQFFVVNICYALGEMRIAGFITISFNAFYLPLMILLYKMNVYTIEVAIFSEYALQMLLLIVPLIMIGGKHIRLYKDLLKPMKKENDSVGLKVFAARIIFLPSFDMDKLILGAFHSIENVGFFTLAKMFASPTIILGQSVAQSLYRRYSDKNVISKKINIITLISIIVLGFFVLLCGYIIVKKFMNQSCLPVLSVLPLAVIAAAINGYIAVFTGFMDAKGMASEVRSCAIVGTVASVILNFSLIIPFGMIGGMASRIIVLLIMLVMRIYYCARYSKREFKVC